MDSKGKFPLHGGASAEIFKNAALLRKNMTVAEKKLWEYLRIRPLGKKFRRQHPFYLFILDFYCHELKLSIEIDGENHQRKVQKEYDSNRTRILGEFGIIEIRFSNDKVLNNFKNVVPIIERAIEETSRITGKSN